MLIPDRSVDAAPLGAADVVDDEQADATSARAVSPIAALASLI
jgi:hypothetical protein